jgi:hypothetical protein
MPGFTLFTGDFLDFLLPPFKVFVWMSTISCSMIHPEFPSIILSPHKSIKDRIKY